MSTKRATQSLSYPLRLPDGAQEEVLRLLDVSRKVINAVIARLWTRLDEFNTRTNSYAYKQVEAMMVSPLPHGHRQYRCEAEQAGRILRAQAARKQQFALILPLLSLGMIRPPTEQRRAGKEQRVIKQALADLKQRDEDGGKDVELQSLIEQACNFYLNHGCFPDCYEHMQELPIQHVAQLPYAGDDGAALGQTYRLTMNLEKQHITLALRCPDAVGQWSRTWREHPITLDLPEYVVLKYKCFLAGIHLEWQQPRGTSHTCPRCEKPAETYSSPQHRSTVIDWGAWLCCAYCHWNGSRDYAAALNIARLGVAYLKEAQRVQRLVNIHHPYLAEAHVKPVSYIGTGAPLRFPAPSPRARLFFAGKMYCNGWVHAVTLHSSYPTKSMLRLCG